MFVRYYIALTNKCNRSCELCSCYSCPTKKTFLRMDDFKKIIAPKKNFEVQFEGGEPLLHPQLLKFVKLAEKTGRCQKIILCTNGVLLPKSVASLKKYFLSNYPSPFLLKMSINYYLIRADKQHLDKAECVKMAFEEMQAQKKEYSVIFNVRRRKKPLAEDDDLWLVDEVKRRKLDKVSNIFFYQRYGQASNRSELDLPYIIARPVEFYLINPDGKNYGTDLIKRAEAMKKLI